MSSHPDVDESLSSGCPWLNTKKNPVLNPRNLMPDLPQTAAIGQKVELSTEREISSIPKTGSGGTKWEYPSPQQFFHALRRRNKEAEEIEMDDVVYVHNRVNEDSWKLVLDWERMHRCEDPSLQRFIGKSEEPSWKSKILKSLGLLRGEELFDRHDWFVDRCGTRTVRYIVDYYDTSENGKDGFGVRIDARPAMDSLGDVWDRIRKPWWDWRNS